MCGVHIYVFMNDSHVQSVVTIFHTLFLKMRFFSLCHSSRNFECLQKELGRIFRILVCFSQFDAKIFLKCELYIQRTR